MSRFLFFKQQLQSKKTAVLTAVFILNYKVLLVTTTA
jgi:hypothetical protein